MTTTPAGAQPRFFYGLWPDADTAKHLRQSQHCLPGKKTHPDDFHLTLAFLGEQPKQALPALHTVLQRLSSYDMTCMLDIYGCFKNLDLVWAGMTAPPRALFDLHRELQQALRESGISFRHEAAFRPHITLARKVKTAPRATFPPLAWRPCTLALAQSGGGPGGGRYRILASRQFSTERDNNP